MRPPGRVSCPLRCWLMGRGRESNTPGLSVELRGSEFHFFRWGNIEDVFILRIRKEYLKGKKSNEVIIDVPKSKER